MVRSNRRRRRRGFTLVETFVVVGIILALVSLGAVTIIKTLNYQQRRNTETAVSKLDQAMQKQWKRVIDTAKSETPHPIATALANGDARRAQVIHILMCLKREFPTSFKEATNPCQNVAPLPGFAANPAYVRLLASASAASLARSPEDQASACLYMALKQSRRGGDFDPDTSLSSQEVVDPFNDGIKEISDGWGNPISFIRWPSSVPWAAVTPPIQYGKLQLFSLNNPPDKEDPEGLLDPAWLNSVLNQPAPVPAQAAVLFSLASQSYPYPYYPVNNLAGPQQQYLLTPVILSRGGDGTLWTTDDIYNFQLSP